MKEKMKNVVWTEDDERFFFERYEKSGTNKPSYLVNCASHLMMFNVYKEVKIYDAVERLLERFFSDFPDNIDFMPLALLLKGRINLRRGDVESAIMCFEEAVELENQYPQTNVGAWLQYAETIVKYQKSQYYSRVDSALLAHFDTVADNVFGYSAARLLTVIASFHQDAEKEKYYTEIACKLRADLLQHIKALRYVNAIKINNDSDNDIKDSVVDFLVNNYYSIVVRNDTFVWQRRANLCLNNLALYWTYDEVFIVAYISFRNAGSNQEVEMGLNGFIAGFGKWPFKKRVKKLENLIASSNKKN